MKRVHFLAVLLVILSLLALLQAQNNVSQPAPVLVSPSTAGTVAMTSAAISANTAQSIKTSAGNLYGVSMANSNTSVCWLQFYNASSAPTCGTGVVFSLAVPSSGSLNAGPNVFAFHNFSTGIGFCAGTTATGATACTTALTGTILYQ
jgi:hypothetical protein